MKYPCDQCEFQATNKGRLTYHIQTVHNHYERRKLKQYDCNYDECQQQFTTRGNLKQHIESDHAGVRYECGQCNKKFTSKIGLKKHLEAIHEVD